MTATATKQAPRLIALRGLPASGKTTASRAWVAQDPENRASVGRDGLRDALGYKRRGLSYGQEKAISAVQKGMVIELLRGGKSVVIDDLNLKLAYLKGWQKLAAEEGVEFSVLDTNASVEQCIKRDAKRPERTQVGEKKIRDLARRFHRRPELPPLEDVEPVAVEVYVPDESLPSAFIVDVDGTLALNMTGRSFYDMTRTGEDSPNTPVIEMVRGLKAMGNEIVIMSARTTEAEIDTAIWLDEHLGREVWSEIYMRDEGDVRRDAVVKGELFAEVAKRYAVRGVIDDRASVCAAWRARGLMCAQVAPGQF